MQIDLKQIAVRPVFESEQPWVALLSFSASALKCTTPERWIGWNYRRQYGRLKRSAHNSRFLILPECHLLSLGSKVLALCTRRIKADWPHEIQAVLAPV